MFQLIHQIMTEKFIENLLNDYGYKFDRNNGILNNVSSLNKLSSDILMIMSNLTLSNIETPSTQEKDKLELHKSITLSNEERTQFPFIIEEPFIFKLTDYESRRKIISDTIFQEASYGTQGSKYPLLDNKYKETLNQMFQLYDYYFFSNLISFGLKKGNGKIDFDFSSRLTSTGGTCRRDGICTYNIKLSSDRLNNIKPENISAIKINGIQPKDRVDGLQLIFEHELIHAVLSIFKDDLSGHNNLFKTIVLNLFGHTKITHGITDRVLSASHTSGNLGSNIKKEKLTKSDLHIGDRVYFIQNDIRNYGEIVKLNPKRAKINTASGVWNVYYASIKK